MHGREVCQWEGETNWLACVTVCRAVDTDVQLRSYSPDGRADVGLVFKCGAFNVIDVNHPIGELAAANAILAWHAWQRASALSFRLARNCTLQAVHG